MDTLIFKDTSNPAVLPAWLQWIVAVCAILGMAWNIFKWWYDKPSKLEIRLSKSKNSDEITRTFRSESPFTPILELHLLVGEKPLSIENIEFENESHVKQYFIKDTGFHNPPDSWTISPKAVLVLRIKFLYIKQSERIRAKIKIAHSNKTYYTSYIECAELKGILGVSLN